MRQLTRCGSRKMREKISKLPMRQLTVDMTSLSWTMISKLPMRQLTSYLHFYLLD